MRQIPVTEQAEVLAFLEAGGLGVPSERIDTHAAIVLLAGDRAYKLKRAVRFSFLDQATLGQRERIIRAEFRLNKRTAPMLYHRVLAVTREADGGLAIAGSGPPVEWLLEMTRFPSDMQLDRMLARGAVDDAVLDALAHAIAQFHEGAERRAEMGGCGAMRAVVDGNADDLAQAGDLLDQDLVERVVTSIDAALEERRVRLDRRRAQGLVRRCHGDLHLANIVVLEGMPVLFDCLEFDETLATVDVLYDLAFLIMDLLEHGASRPAWRVLQGYLDWREDDEGLGLLPLFIAVRATIRAKVAALGARMQQHDGERARTIASAHRYLVLASSCLKPTPARLLAIGGRSGTGKSSLAEVLAPRLGEAPGAVVLRSDVIRKRLFGRRADERLPPEAYTAEVSIRVFEHIAKRAVVLLAAGWTVIVDGVYGRAEQRQQIEAVAQAVGLPFTGVWLEAPEEVLLARVDGRVGDASDADVAVVRQQRDMLGPDAGWHRIRADRPLHEELATIEALLAGPPPVRHAVAP